MYDWGIKNYTVVYMATYKKSARTEQLKIESSIIQSLHKNWATKQTKHVDGGHKMALF